MKNINEVLSEVVSTCVVGQIRNRGEVFGKAVEEVGELSTAIFIPQKAPESAMFESCDLVIAAIDNCFMSFLQEQHQIYATHGMEVLDQEKLEVEFREYFASHLNSKLDKWKGLIASRQGNI